MKAVLLAAGIASRLKPLTDNTPKCLLKVGDKPILQRMIENLQKNGINDVVVVTGYLNYMIEEFLNNNFPDVNFTFLHNEKFNSTNNIYSLWMTKNEIIGSDMLLLDSDIIFDGDIIKLLLNSKHENCLAVRSDQELGEEEIKIMLKENGAIKEISKVVEPSAAVGESIGIEKFSKKLVEKLFAILDEKIINKNEINIFYEAAFQDAINSGEDIYPVNVGELKCMEIDTPDDFEIANQLVTQIDNN